MTAVDKADAVKQTLYVKWWRQGWRTSDSDPAEVWILDDVPAGKSYLVVKTAKGVAVTPR